MKGVIEKEGFRVEIEGSSPGEVAEAIQKIINPEVYRSRDGIEPTAKNPASGKKQRKSKGRRAINLKPWKDEEVLTIAQIALQHGEDRAGLGDKVVRALKSMGNERSDTNTRIFAAQIHKYIYGEDTKGNRKVSAKARRVLRDNGFNPLTGGSGDPSGETTGKTVEEVLGHRPGNTEGPQLA